jgi:hypothetical protein
MQAPSSQHHTALAGPPNVNGVLKVVAIELHRPYVNPQKLEENFGNRGTDHDTERETDLQVFFELSGRLSSELRIHAPWQGC